MKQSFKNLIGILAFSLIIPISSALAGPDSQEIDHIRRLHQDEQTKNKTVCPPPKPIYQMDKGPRLKCTTEKNKALKEEYEKKLKACNLLKIALVSIIFNSK